MYSLPYQIEERGTAEHGIFAQDTWSAKRLTVTGGIRFDHFIGKVLAQTADASTAAYGPAAGLGARQFAEVNNVPNLKDLTPRVGGSYDVFGNGRTAIRGTVGKYLNISGSSMTGQMNPITRSVNSANRPWNDDGDLVPECDFANLGTNGECGPINRNDFGQLNERSDFLSDEVLRGTGNRIGFWDYGIEFSHRVSAALTLSGGYYHNFPNKFLMTDNQLVDPSHFDSYCFTSPTDTALPSGIAAVNPGREVCGLYDIIPAQRGQESNVMKQAKAHVDRGEFMGYTWDPSKVNCGYQDPGQANNTVGNRTNAQAFDICGVNDFINLSFTARAPGGITFGGGVDAGTTNRNSCFVIDSPQALFNCDQTIPWSQQLDVRANATWPLNFIYRGLSLSANYQDGPGPNRYADYGVVSREITFDNPARDKLAACGGAPRATCTATANVPLLDPFAEAEPRRRQLDFRFSKNFQITRRVRLNTGVQMGNVLNASDTTQLTTAYGNRWLLPITMQAQRQFNLSGSLSF
jgi:hypothetical protein